MTGTPGVFGRTRPWHVANLLAVTALFAGLSIHPLLDPDGSRYPEVAREMLERGDWITPTQNYVPFFHKPPLLYWMLMVSLRVLGETELAANIVPALCGLAGMAVAWWLGVLTVGRAAARWVPPILATMVIYFVCARLPSTDIPLSVAFAAALTAWWSAERAQRGRGWRLALAGVFLGLATLSKGPTAMVLFVGAVAAYLIWSRQVGKSLAGLGLPLLVATVVAAPWFIAVGLRNPEFFEYYFVFQHFQRFTAIGYVDHPKPWYFYLPYVLGGALMWSLLWPPALVGWRQRWRELTAEQRGAAQFLICWAGFVLLLFSASECKLISYILPMFWPPAVVSALVALRLVSTERLSLWTRLVAVAPVVVGAGGLAFLLWWSGRQAEMPPAALRHATVLYAALMLLSAAAFISTLLWRGPQRRLAALAVGAALFLIALLPLFQAGIANRKMGGVLPEALVQQARKGEWTLAQYDCYNASLCFYTRSRVVLIDEIGLEMSMGPDQPDGHYWFRKGEGAIDELSREGPLALWVKRKMPPQFAARHGLTQVVSNRERRLLVNDAGLEQLGLR